MGSCSAMGAFVFVITNASNFLLALAFARTVSPNGPWERRLLVGTCCFVLSATALVTLLGAAGMLSTFALLLVASILGIGAAFYLYRTHQRIAEPNPAGLETSLPYRAAASGFVALPFLERVDDLPVPLHV